MKAKGRRVDFEFTCALNNPTGKYFVCQDIIEGCGDLIQNVRYWRMPSKRFPAGIVAKILSRLAVEEVNFRLQSRWSRFLPLMRNRRPLVFSDPREVILYDLKGRDIVICHDLGPITHPSLYHPSVEITYKAAFEKIRRARPRLVFVSEYSLKTFAAFYGDDYPSMKLIYPALRLAVASGPAEPIPAAPRRFLLTVGAVGSRKNQRRSIEAFVRSGLAEEGFCYVICGGPEPGYKSVLEAAGNVPGVILAGYVSDSQLRWLYEKANGFVLPSLLEGFGLPAAEAVSRGLIPLVSAGGALHEVAGDCAMLVDPLNVDEIADGMRRLAHMEEAERQERLPELRNSIARFSRGPAVAAWRATIQQALLA
ncbi:MAG: glycosyltransferase [Beijerinckiaceae bacterium]|nr:glycosyltransferase [Beijerinckiaceae bacterium]